MARGDFPFNRLELNLQPIVARLRHAWGPAARVRRSTLTATQRHDLPSSDFAFPDREGYPVPDRGHAQAALSRVSQQGTPAEKKKVRAFVHRKYPDMDAGGYA